MIAQRLPTELFTEASVDQVDVLVARYSAVRTGDPNAGSFAAEFVSVLQDPELTVQTIATLVAAVDSLVDVLNREVGPIRWADIVMDLRAAARSMQSSDFLPVPEGGDSDA